MPDSANSSVVKLRRKGAHAQQRAPAPAGKADYVPTTPETAIIAAREWRMAKTATTPTITVTMKDGVAQIGYKTEADFLVMMELLALHDEVALNGYLAVLGGYVLNDDGDPDGQTMNRIVNFVASMKPRDQAETLLLTQMAAIHMATMRFAGNSNRERRVDVKESYQRSVNKLARTYAAQMQTLKQYRSDGKQKIVVKHVTVNEGGQAIVGDVTHGGGAGGASENLEATA
jgi:hypothetical protein